MGSKKKKKPGDFAWAVLLSRIPLQVKGSREVNTYSEERSQRAALPPQYTRDGTRAQLCRGSKSKTDPRSSEHSLMARPQALCNLILSSQHPGGTGIPD